MIFLMDWMLPEPREVRVLDPAAGVEAELAVMYGVDVPVAASGRTFDGLCSQLPTSGCKPGMAGNAHRRLPHDQELLIKADYIIKETLIK